MTDVIPTELYTKASIELEKEIKEDLSAKIDEEKAKAAIEKNKLGR